VNAQFVNDEGPTLFANGDVSGHRFHGNQWTQDSEGNSVRPGDEVHTWPVQLSSHHWSRYQPQTHGKGTVEEVDPHGGAWVRMPDQTRTYVTSGAFRRADGKTFWQQQGESAKSHADYHRNVVADPETAAKDKPKYEKSAKAWAATAEARNLGGHRRAAELHRQAGDEWGKIPWQSSMAQEHRNLADKHERFRP
jgi:hypothetical protein